VPFNPRGKQGAGVNAVRRREVFLAERWEERGPLYEEGTMFERKACEASGRKGVYCWRNSERHILGETVLEN